jgi:hypothetical protein
MVLIYSRFVPNSHNFPAYGCYYNHNFLSQLIGGIPGFSLLFYMRGAGTRIAGVNRPLANCCRCGLRRLDSWTPRAPKSIVRPTRGWYSGVLKMMSDGLWSRNQQLERLYRKLSAPIEHLEEVCRWVDVQKVAWRRSSVEPLYIPT